VFSRTIIIILIINIISISITLLSLPLSHVAHCYKPDGTIQHIKLDAEIDENSSNT